MLVHMFGCIMVCIIRVVGPGGCITLTTKTKNVPQPLLGMAVWHRRLVFQFE